MSEPTPTKAARRNVEQFLDHIDDDTEWTVVDYNPDIDPYQLTTVTLTVEHNADQENYTTDDTAREVETVSQVIRELNANGDDGAEVSEIVEKARDDGNMTESRTMHTLEKLRIQGVVYEHPTDHMNIT